MGILNRLYSILLPEKFRAALNIKCRALLVFKKRREKRIIKRLQRKEILNVTFLAQSVSLWKNDELFLKFLENKHYKPIIFLAPRVSDSQEIQKKHLESMKKYFDEKHLPWTTNANDLKTDILFYAQPYTKSQPPSLSIFNNLDILTCYIPYAFFISNYKWAYNQKVHNLAWTLFYPTKLHLQNAKELALNKGKNVKVVGYPLASAFLSPPKEDPWKIKDRNVKRIIYAAHHSIFADDMADCSTFLKYRDKILDLARQNPDCEFAFKPHPHLREHLYRHPDFGKAKTEAYFNSWNEAPNTFLAEGDYLDLFKTSDALIHDCGSFTVEYLYTGKPVLYIGNDRDSILCHFGKIAMSGNYTLRDFSIETFLENLKQGIDPKKETRKKIYEDYLTPPNQKTFEENILDYFERILTKNYI